MPTASVEFDPFSDVFFEDPYPTYRRLRDEAPVYMNEKYGFVADQELGIWTAPSGDQVAWFKDPDGNVLSLSHHA